LTGARSERDVNGMPFVGGGAVAQRVPRWRWRRRRKLGRGELDLPIVFDHDFAPTAVPDTLTVDRLFDDPVEILLPATTDLPNPQ
jgi:hypothetical protein